MGLKWKRGRVDIGKMARGDKGRQGAEPIPCHGHQFARYLQLLPNCSFLQLWSRVCKAGGLPPELHESDLTPWVLLPFTWICTVCASATGESAEHGSSVSSRLQPCWVRVCVSSCSGGCDFNTACPRTVWCRAPPSKHSCSPSCSVQRNHRMGWVGKRSSKIV